MKVQFAQKALIVEGDRLLLIRKGGDDPYNPGKWEIPGGRLKDQETLEASLQREVVEEVGLTVEVGPPLAIWSWTLGDSPDADTVVAVARVCTPESTEDVNLEGNDDSDYLAEW